MHSGQECLNDKQCIQHYLTYLLTYLDEKPEMTEQTRSVPASSVPDQTGRGPP